MKAESGVWTCSNCKWFVRRWASASWISPSGMKPPRRDDRAQVGTFERGGAGGLRGAGSCSQMRSTEVDASTPAPSKHTLYPNPRMEGMTDRGTVANFSENERILQKHLNLAPTMKRLRR